MLITIWSCSAKIFHLLKFTCRYVSSLCSFLCPYFYCHFDDNLAVRSLQKLVSFVSSKLFLLKYANIYNALGLTTFLKYQWLLLCQTNTSFIPLFHSLPLIVKTLITAFQWKQMNTFLYIDRTSRTSSLTR